MEMRRERIRLRLLALLAAIAMTAVACSGGGESATTEPSPAGEGGAATTATDVDPMAGLERVEAKESYRIGYAFPHFRDTYWIGMGYGIESEAERAGVTIVRALEAGGYTNVDTQIKQIDDMVQLGVDAIILGAIDRVAVVPAVEAACRAGVHVIFAGNVANSECADVAVALANEPFAEKAAEYVCEALDGQGNVVMLAGAEGADWAMIRDETFRAKLAEDCPGVKVLDKQWSDVDRTEGQRIMEDWIQRYGDQIDAVYAALNLFAEGAVTALRAAGMNGDVVVVTSNIGADTIDMLKAGDIDLVAQEPAVLIGRWALNYAVRVLNGDTDLPNVGPMEDGTPLPKRVVYPPIGFYTADNVDTMDPYAYDWAPDGWVPGSGV